MPTALPLLAVAFALSPDRPAFDPVDRYAERTVEGWKALVNHRLLIDEELSRETLRLLSDQLHQIARVVPAGPLAKLRAIPIWVELAHPKHPCMCYHPSADWLRSNGMNPAKAGAVELANARNFLS